MSTTETPANSTAAPKFGDFGVPPRPSTAVQAELTAALAQFAVWERENSEHHEIRKDVIADNKQIVKEWGVKHPNRPVPPHKIPGYTPVPEVDSPVGLKFHALHYTIERLKAELDAAKKVEAGR